MLPGRHGAEAFCEKLEILKQKPELLEKYLIESGASPEVRALFLTRLFGSDRSSAVSDATEAVGSAMGDLNSPLVIENGVSACKKLTVVELEQQVLDLKRQVLAIQRQLKMQRQVSEVAASIEGLLEKVASACERRVAETDESLRAEIRKVDAGSRDVARNLGDLKRELQLRVRSEDLGKLAEEVSLLKQGFNSRISAVETRTAESLNQGKIERIDKKSDPLDGIIARLTRECGGNVHKKGVIEVTRGCSAWPPEHAVDLGSGSEAHFYDSQVCYDFRGWRVNPAGYSIRSAYYAPGGPHPKSWVLEVSNDGSEGSWKVVDSRENNSDLNDYCVTRNFAISAPASGAFRFVRLRLTGKNHQGSVLLPICAFELFGALSRA